MFKSKKELEKHFREQISTNAAWAVRALMVIFSYQTLVEQETEETRDHNGVGFTSTDAEFLTSLHNQYVERDFLSDKQMEKLLKIMPKYSRQLVEHSLRIGRVRKENGQYVIVPKNSPEEPEAETA